MSQDSIKKKLLIIKSKPTSLGTVEGFLKNRDWTIKSTTNLKEALIFLVQEQPQFVMVSIDHPNRKVRNLPKILAQAFPVCVIVFAEENSAASFNMLNTSNSEYVLYPPITGPAVERTVNKFYKDQQAKGVTNPFQRTGSSTAEDGSVIAIKGEGGTLSSQNAQSILQQLLGGDDGSNQFSGGHTTDSSISAGGQQNKSNIGYMPGTNSELNLGLMQPSGQNNGLGPGWAQQGHGAGNSMGSGIDESDETLNAMLMRQNAANKAAAGWAPMPTTTRRKERPTPEQIEDNPLSAKKDSIILRGTKDALEKSCIKTSFAESEAIENSTNISCIVIESTRFSGYLITAMGKDRKLDDAFLRKVRERLFRFLKENGEKIEDSESMQLNIKEVPFEEWALEQAEFLRKSVHEGNEVAMAFFPRQDIKTTFGDSADEEMASIHLNELAGDVAVEFNVYIYLPKNNKYVLYTPRGSKFFDVQKQRLQNQGISNLHILKADIQDLDKYRAQNFLNEKIHDFEAKQKDKVVA
ncbi:hypothetical protein AB1A81_05460 [Bdellovibrio bacteriovorus]|nr:hypothetical protein [Bdellovibrio bacteriovorus]AHZ86413.1 hypothetical protein EP01_15940 [Bdellovibrio bacteriovorus]BEV67654.1 hypothetical protein Bb109J_c1074 [Bdellovibrio bacteriovorus]